MDKEHCNICGLECKELNVLLNGNVYHESCYTNILAEAKEYEREEFRLETETWRLKEEINKPFGLLDLIALVTIIPLLFRDDSKVVAIKSRIKQLEEISKGMKAAKHNGSLSFLIKLGLLYDVWPTRPPDWDDRKRKVYLANSGCGHCGDDRRLHVHHKIAIKSGGNHKKDNLVLLCEDCHEKEHGGRKFRYSNDSGNTKKTPFQKRLELTKTAIREEAEIEFKYTSWKGEKSNRRIKPVSILNKGKSVCVRGYCYLRKEDRTFAIKRMAYAKVRNKHQ